MVGAQRVCPIKHLRQSVTWQDFQDIPANLPLLKRGRLTERFKGRPQQQVCDGSVSWIRVTPPWTFVPRCPSLFQGR